MGTKRPLSKAHVPNIHWILLGLECLYVLMRNDRDMIVNFKLGEYMRNIIPYAFSLEGNASYQTDGGIKSLHLDGRSGYAKIPAINFTKSSFSIALRFYVHNSHCLGHLISDWSSPGKFRLYVNHRKVFVELRRSGVVQTLLNVTSDRLVKTRSHNFFKQILLHLFLNTRAGGEL